MDRASIILNNFATVENDLLTSCKSGGRSINDVQLMAVTKYAKDEDVLFALQQDKLKHIGESRLQQALSRWTSAEFAKFNVIKHFIGHVQTNKAAKIAKFFDFVDSVDSLKVANALNKNVPIGKKLKVLVQIKLTNRNTQSGVNLNEAPKLVQQIKNLANLQACGYMAIAPQCTTNEELRNLFRQVKTKFDKDFITEKERYLSLGMSNDFEIAVEEGSTLPRIGSSLFSNNLEDI